jgi:GNAT superfamily N-acetyltransferase
MSELRKFFIDPNHGIHRSCEHNYYQWKIFKNQFGSGLAWLAEVENKPIGMVSISPRPLIINGKITSSGELGDGFVHPDFQGQGVFSTLLKLILNDADNLGYEFTYGTPTKQAYSVEKRVGYHLYNGDSLNLMVRPVNLKLLLNRYDLPKWVMNPAASIGQPLYNLLFHRVQTNTFKHVNKNFSEHVNIIKNCYDRFQKDIHIDISDTYLKWRYETNPDSYSIGFTQIDNGNNSFCIIKQGQSSGLDVGYIADYGYTDTKNSPKVLFSNAIEYLTKKNVSLIAIWAGTLPNDIKTLRRLGFFSIKLIDVIYRIAPGIDLDINDLSWRFCLSDSDNI